MDVHLLRAADGLDTDDGVHGARSLDRSAAVSKPVFANVRVRVRVSALQSHSGRWQSFLTIFDQSKLKNGAMKPAAGLSHG